MRGASFSSFVSCFTALVIFIEHNQAHTPIRITWVADIIKGVIILMDEPDRTEWFDCYNRGCDNPYVFVRFASPALCARIARGLEHWLFGPSTSNSFEFEMAAQSIVKPDQGEVLMDAAMGSLSAAEYDAAAYEALTMCHNDTLEDLILQRMILTLLHEDKGDRLLDGELVLHAILMRWWGGMGEGGGGLWSHLSVLHDPENDL